MSTLGLSCRCVMMYDWSLVDIVDWSLLATETCYLGYLWLILVLEYHLHDTTKTTNQPNSRQLAAVRLSMQYPITQDARVTWRMISHAATGAERADRHGRSAGSSDPWLVLRDASACIPS